MRLWVLSLVLLNKLRIWHCLELQYRLQMLLHSNLALLWLWRRPTAGAPIQPLAWELPYAMGMALKSKKLKKKLRQDSLWTRDGTMCTFYKKMNTVLNADLMQFVWTDMSETWEKWFQWKIVPCLRLRLMFSINPCAFHGFKKYTNVLSKVWFSYKVTTNSKILVTYIRQRGKIIIM